MIDIEFHPDTADEIRYSRKWYEQQTTGLGQDFLDEIEVAINTVRQLPDTWPIFHGKYRRYILRRFPYSLIYRLESEKIYVLAVMHNSRKPGYWQGRN